jgi:FAD/FMN-containing dehydrogenase
VQALAPWHHTERMINFLGHDMDPASVTAAYPAEIAGRLTALKQELDPHGIFCHGPALPSQTIRLPKQSTPTD